MAAEGLEQAVLCADQVNLFMKTVYKSVCANSLGRSAVSGIVR